MIQDPSKELTLIVYNTPKPPKYIKLNKGLIKVLIFTIPLIVIVSIGSSLISSVYMKRKLENVRSKEPEIILQLKKEKEELAQEVKALKSTNITLTQKISAGGKGTVSPLNLMAMFTTPLGFEDRRGDNLAKLENINSDQVNKNILFKFDLINNKQDTSKLSGYVTIVQYHTDGISYYPSYELSVESPRLEYSQGESFTVSRFRPVIAEFAKPNGNNVWYKIFIFSRTGNLLAYKKAGPFQLN
jgi:hypothetical protein